MFVENICYTSDLAAKEKVDVPLACQLQTICYCLKMLCSNNMLCNAGTIIQTGKQTNCNGKWYG